MSVWPEDLKVGPLREWPGVLTPTSQRKNSSFRASFPSTLTLLDQEIRRLATTQAHVESAEMLVAIPAHEFRRDGRPYARAVAEHPGVVFSMDTAMGHVSYPSDLHLTWQENLRAIALTLQALRAVTRYGVTRNGEQYRGSLAIESEATSSVDEALTVIATMANEPEWFVRAQFGISMQRAKRRAHPDTGGDALMWSALMDAERVVRQAGVL